jgi:dynein heavy chain 2
VIQSAATALLSGAVPADWTRQWEAGPEKPQAWLRELVRKRAALVKWKTTSAKGSLLHDPLALGDLFNPATFLNALRQQSARLLNTAIDRVTMISSWDKNPDKVESACPLPCALSNLLLQGASFHGGGLQESSPDASEMAPTPNVTIGFVPVTSPLALQALEGGRAIGIPVYLTPSREDFLVEIQVPVGSSEDNKKWLLSGVALFLTEDD